MLTELVAGANAEDPLPFLSALQMLSVILPMTRAHLHSPTLKALNLIGLAKVRRKDLWLFAR